MHLVEHMVTLTKSQLTKKMQKLKVKKEIKMIASS
jgi:hypothetical protein